jgi:hypothetical protein
LYDTLITNVRDVDDEFNIIPAGALAGATYSVTRGARTMAKSGLIGFAATLVYLGLSKREEIARQIPFLSMKNNNKY